MVLCYIYIGVGAVHLQPYVYVWSVLHMHIGILQCILIVLMVYFPFLSFRPCSRVVTSIGLSRILTQEGGMTMDMGSSSWCIYWSNSMDTLLYSVSSMNTQMIYLSSLLTRTNLECVVWLLTLWKISHTCTNTHMTCCIHCTVPELHLIIVQGK